MAHGTDGPFKIQDHRYVCGTAHRFVEAMAALGVPKRNDFNAGETKGAGLTQISAAYGRRCSAANAFLDPLKDDRRLTVRTRARVERIIFAGNRAVGVRFVERGVVREESCEHEIVLAAGAYNSPKLLMLSGVGPAEHLTDLGIAMVADLPGVGQNMQDHNMVPVMATARHGHGYYREDRGLRLLWNALRYACGRRGPLAATGSEAVAFVNPDDSAAEPSLQIYCMGFLPPGVSDNPGVMLCPTLIRPASFGWLRLNSADPAEKPLISPNYFSHPNDLAQMVRGVRYCRNILRTEPLAQIVQQEIAPGSGRDCDCLVVGAYSAQSIDRRTVGAFGKRESWHNLREIRGARNALVLELGTGYGCDGHRDVAQPLGALFRCDDDFLHGG
jgi:choline dehydrogenase